MLHRPALTDDQRKLLSSVMIIVSTSVVSMVATTWAIVSLVVGSIDLARWIGGL